MRMSKIMLIIFEVIIGGLILLFCINFFYNTEKGGKKGAFEIIGDSSVNTTFVENESNSANAMGNVQTTESPSVICTNRVFNTSDIVNLLDLIEVKPAGSSEYYSGADGSIYGFTVSIIDVMDDYGNSVITGSLEGSDESEEDYATVYYNKETLEVQFNTIGVYRVSIKVIGENGRYSVTEIRIPVEVA